MANPTRREQLEAMLRDDPADDFLRYALAMEYVGAADHETAVRLFREQIALKPERPYVPAYLMAAQSLLKLGRTTEAADLLRQGVEQARAQNNLHAMGEMQGLLDGLEP